MILILTNFNSDRKCLVNMNNVETSYVIWDKEERRYKTKVCFRGNESFIFVEESLQEIHKLCLDYHNGIHQTSDWETTSITEQMERMFNYHESLSNEIFNSTDF
jgi:hypothetical protein